jgi:opacity protein-like surface antigen
MRRSLIISVAVLLLAAESGAAELEVTAPESVVRRAPFDVAPEVGRVHAGDKLTGGDQASGAWRFVQLPGGGAGYLRDADVKVGLPPEVSVAPVAGLKVSEPVAPPPSPPVAVVAAAPDPVTVPPHEASTLPSAQLGVMFEMMPNGSIATSNTSGGSDVTTDAAFAVAVAPTLDVPVGRPYFSLGFSPQILLGVKGSGADTQSSTEYDLRARITIRDPVSPQGTVYLRFSPGYSIVSIANLSPNLSNPTGPVFDLSVGTEVSVGSKLVFVFDLGYQLGLQSTSVAGANADFNTRFLHVGVGFALGT